MFASKNGGIVLPSDVTNKMLMEYCDHTTLCNTRELQSTHVRRCTRFDDMIEAIEAGNLENAKWIDSHNDEWKEEGDLCLAWAAHGGHLDCLEWLFHAMGCSSDENDDNNERGFDFIRLRECIAASGHLNCLKWFFYTIGYSCEEEDAGWRCSLRWKFTNV